MNDELKAHYESKSQDLRAQLKRWESEWANAHGGSKPGRQDIKDNPDIAEKYKKYNQVRGILTGKIPPPKDDDSRSRKRRADPPPSQTPLKRTRHTETPRTDRVRDEELMNTPGISRKLFSPAKVTSLGPTPQKDGRVLGLFDLLVERELGTPSSKSKETTRKSSQSDSIHKTPSKRTGQGADDSRLGRTPMSASKRRGSNSAMTPLKNRSDPACGQTPTSVSKLQFDTPAFLKRHTLPTLDENGSFDMPAPLKLPRKPFARGLSEIVASLRKVEEEKLDDDLDALREAENEEAGIIPSRPPLPPPTVTNDEPRNLPLGGFDDEAMYDSPVEDALDRNGNPLAVYKKKGQKRTTRRVNMKPTWIKRPGNMGDKNDSADADEPDADGTGDYGNGQKPGAQEEDSDSDDGEDQRKKSSRAKKGDAKKDGPVKKTLRKVNELAHANFQRLKLRNSGAKGGPGHNSRFRRRR
ncbi:hypothetical protein HIM_03431 [Hirsutella minnesotensis 3608]|uniref:DNA replication regulator SLD2 n=1 Tax=Hirsutella minnesotensis 3608 TaxID=1043627 RepID=A0A0F7ZQE5_9HYPO|nr:hypothetical protein HIM_03431 [Hirsutella minnesotensis 3608]